MVRSMNGSDYRGKLILQEFIPGGDDAMRVLNSYSDTDGTVRAMCLGQPVLEYYDPKSVGNYAAILSRGDTLLYDKMQRFLQAIGYTSSGCRAGRWTTARSFRCRCTSHGGRRPRPR